MDIANLTQTNPKSRKERKIRCRLEVPEFWHERERRKQLVAEWKRREEEKLDAGTSSGSSDPEKHWDNWKHFEVRQVRTQSVARVSKHDK